MGDTPDTTAPTTKQSIKQTSLSLLGFLFLIQQQHLDVTSYPPPFKGGRCNGSSVTYAVTHPLQPLQVHKSPFNLHVSKCNGTVTAQKKYPRDSKSTFSLTKRQRGTYHHTHLIPNSTPPSPPCTTHHPHTPHTPPTESSRL